MEYAIGYVAAIFFLQAVAAFRTPNQDCQAVIIGSVLWPVFLVLVLGSLFMDWIGWDMDTQRGLTMFGFRKPTNTKVRGFALTLFRVEFQVWKARKG
jgi:hypothetical protein